MDDNAANNTLTAEVGPDGSWHAVSDDSARNTSNDSVAADNFRGRALDTQNGTGYGKLAVGTGTVHDNDFLKKGAVIFKIAPESFGYDDAANQVIFDLYQGANDSIILRYNATNDDFELVIKWGGTTLTLDTAAYTENYSLQREMSFIAAWDSDKNFGLLAQDGQVIEVGSNTGTPTASHPSVFSIGALNDRTTPGDYIIDEIKTFSEALLPYGAYHIGNSDGLLAGIDNPHADLTFFWDCQASGSGAAKGGANLATDYTVTLNGSAAITSGAALVGTNGLDIVGSDGTHSASVPIASADIIDGRKGSVGIWINPQTFTAALDYFLCFGNDSNNLSVTFNSTDYVYCVYEANNSTKTVTGTTDFTSLTGKWAYIRFDWADADNGSFIRLKVNGVEEDFDSTVTESFTNPSSNTLYIGASRLGDNSTDSFIGRVFISNNPNTPEIWTAMGKPLHVPLIDKQ
jgi:hypothetical protein